jgi:uncharacterized protein (TIGR03435 family)
MYKVSLRQVTGGPDWLEADGYDIEAKADHCYRLDDLRVMFQNLLAARFKLKVHKEVKEGPVYVLTVDKSGSKLKVDERPVDLAWNPLRGNHVWERVSMETFCQWLGPALQSEELPVIDKTGLDKTYDFTLRYLPQLLPNFDKEKLPPSPGIFHRFLTPCRSNSD